MRKLLIPFIATIAFLAPAPAQSQDQPSVWSVAYYADFRTHENSAVVLRRIGSLDQPLGLKCSFDIEGFAGSNMAGDLVAGVAISKFFPVAKNVDFKLGLGTTWQPGQQFKDAGVGLLIGLAYRF